MSEGTKGAGSLVIMERLGDAHRADVRRPDFPFPQGRGALAANARNQNEGTEATRLRIFPGVQASDDRRPKLDQSHSIP